MRAFVVAALLLSAAAARAEVDWGDVGLFAGGAATALFAHEAGHATANLVQGNVPHIEQVSFLGAIPFFAVAPDIYCSGNTCTKSDGSRFGPGRSGLLLILLAGFDVQHITDEVLLTQDPQLRLHAAPFRTGMLAFNTLTSVAYAIGNLSGIEPSAGDLSDAFRDAGASRAWTTGLLLGIAGLDIARWAFPDVEWLAWVSRGAKVAFLGLPLSV
jgi:hypothetical protein